MQVADDVKQVIAKELKLPVERLTDDTKLGDLGAESLDVIEIVFALEEKFNVDITVKMGPGPGAASADTSASPGTDLSGLTTVGDICRAVQVLVDAKASK
jgi:acyl carrier protein